MVTSTPKNPDEEREGKGRGREERNKHSTEGWRMCKKWNTANVFSAVSVLSSLAYLCLCRVSETGASGSGKRILYQVCCDQGDTGGLLGEEGGGKGSKHKRSCDCGLM